MSEYDLGAAHGKIEIETDVDGVDKAIAELAALKAATGAMDGPLDNLDNSMGKVAKSAGGLSERLQSIVDAASEMSSSIGTLVADVSELTGVTGLLQTVMAKAGENATKFAGQAYQLYGTVKALKTPMGIINTLWTTLGYNLLGINKELANMGPGIHKILAFNGKVALLGAIFAGVAAGAAKVAGGFRGIYQNSSFLIKAFSPLTYVFRNSANELNLLGRAGARVVRPFSDAATGTRTLWRNFTQLTAGISQTIFGMAFLRSGLRTLSETFAKLAGGAKIALIAVLGFAALGPIAGLLLGIADAAKQLAGALLILPGVVVALGTIGAVAKVAFGGLGEALKAAKLDGDKFTDAIKDMPEGMQNVAKAMHATKPAFKDLRSDIFNTTFKGFSKDIEDLAGQYMPLLRSGTLGVADGLNGIVKGFVAFYKSQGTMRDTNELFRSSAKITRDFAAATRPLLSGLTNVAMVGVGAFKDLSGGIVGTAATFEAWAIKVRHNGDLRRWIEDGLQGFQDLGTGIRQYTGAFGDMLHAINKGGGDDALFRFADSANKFRDSVNKSLQGGGLQLVFDKLSNLSGLTFDTIKVALEAIFKIMRSMAPFADEFTRGLAAGLQAGAGALGSFTSGLADMLSMFSGLAGPIGQIVGMAVAFKGLLIVIAPLIAVFKLLFGAMLVFRGVSGIMLTAAAALDTYSRKGKALSRTSNLASKAALGMAGALSGPVVAGIMAAVIAMGLWYTTQQNQKRTQEQIREDYLESAMAAKKFADEVLKANGVVSEGAKSALADSVRGMRNAWVDEGKADAKWTDNFGNPFNEGGRVSKKDEAAAESKNAKKALDQLKVSDEDLAQSLSSTDGTWDMFVGQLRGVGQWGEDALKKLQPMRDEAQNIIRVAGEIGPKNLEIANSMGVLGDKTSSATDKLNALKSVMRQLGLIETSAAEATAEWTQTINQQVEKARGAVDANVAMGEAILTSGNKIDATTKNGSSLLLQLASLRDSYYATSLATGDSQKAYDQAMPTIREVINQYGITGKAVDDITASMGFLPKEIQTLITLEKSDAVQQDVQTVINQLKTVPRDVKVPIQVETQEAFQVLKDAGLVIGNFDPKTRSVEVNVSKFSGDDAIKKLQAQLDAAKAAKAKAELEPGSKDKLQSELDKGGPLDVKGKLHVDTKALDEIPTNPDGTVKLPGQAPTAEGTGRFQGLGKPLQGEGVQGGKTPAQIASDEEQKRTLANQKQPEKPKPTGQVDVAKPPPPAAPAADPGKPNIEVTGTDAALGALDAVKGKLASIQDRKINFMISGIDAALGALNSINIGLDNVKNRRTDFSIGGIDAALGALNSINIGLANIPQSTQKNFEMTGTDAAIGAIAEVKRQLDALNPTMDSLRANITGYGQAVLNALNTATGAIKNYVATALNPLNDLNIKAKTSGQALGQGFADGITSKQSAVQAAALKLAQAAAAPLPRSPAKIGPFSGKGWTPFRGQKLAEGFASGIEAGAPKAAAASLNMAMQISNVMDQIRVAFGQTPTGFGANGAGVTGYYRDPEISDEELKTQRAERKKEEAKKARQEAENDAEKAAKSLPNIQESQKKAQERLDKALATQEERKRKYGENPTVAQNKTLGNGDETVSKARESLDKANARLKEAQDLAKSGGTTGVAGAKTDEFIKSLDTATYGMGGFSKAVLDCSGFVSAVANQETGRDPFSERGNTTNMREFLKARGFVEGPGTDGDTSVAWWDQGGGANGHTALTTASGLNAESTTRGSESGVQYGPGVAGARSNNAQFTDFMHLPGGDKAAIQDNAKATENLSKKLDANSQSLTQDEVASLIIAQGKAMNKSDDDIKSALATGIVESGLQNLNYGDRDSVGAFQQRNFAPWTSNGRNRMNVTDAATSFYEQLASVGAGDVGTRAQAVQRSAIPGRYNEEAGKATEIFNRLSKTTGSGTALSVSDSGTADSIDDLTKIQQDNPALAKAIATAQSETSSDAEVIQALQAIDNTAVKLSESEQQTLEGVKSAVMDDRGIKAYDPFEGAQALKDDPIGSGTKFAQDLLSLFNTLEGGVTAAKDMAHLITRGLSNTEEVGTFVDGIQGLVNTVTSMVSTIGGIVDTVASVAALAGSAIPGIGQVGAVISAVTGGIANVNAIVDIVQEVSKIGGRLFGSVLSKIAGGENGALQGNIKTLLDKNDNTLKTWSDRNAVEKTVRPLGGGAAAPTNPNQTGVMGDLNIYAGPGQDPAKLMSAAMFQVKANSGGVYGG